MSISTCKYQKEYSNYETRQIETFQCKENCINGEPYCIFHETFSIKNIEALKISKMQDKLIELINNAIENKEDLKLIGFSIPNLNIDNKKFCKNVYLNHAKFYGNILITNNYFQNFSLNNSKFDCEIIDFSNNIFMNKMDASDSNIKGKKILFHNCDFYGNQVNFNKTTLDTLNEIDFSYSIFYSKLVTFQFTLFTSQQEINFNNCVFFGQVYFSSTFMNDQLVKFSSAKFLGNIITFAGSKFYKRGVTFNRAKFLNKDAVIGFMDIFFSCKEVSFHKVHCYGKKIEFEGSKFNLSKNIDFDYSKFFYCNFNICKFFKGIISFNTTNFENVTFQDTEFSTVYFQKTIFNKADFSNSKFLDNAYFFDCKCNDNIIFHYTIFEKPQKIIFQTHDLSKFSFINTDITRILFADNVKFGNDKKDNYKTYDERIFDLKFKKIVESKEQIELGDLLSLYRNLRENYEYRLRYDLAGKFFIREMELKRKYREVNSISLFAKKLMIRKILHHLKFLRYIETKTDSYIIKNNWWRRNYFSLIGIYRLISNYGESLFFVIIFISIIFSVFTFFWLVQSNANTTSPSFFSFKEFDQMYNKTQWYESIKRSISDITPFLPFHIDPPSSYDYFLKILGFLGFGIVFISLKRKFERRFRH